MQSDLAQDLALALDPAQLFRRAIGSPPDDWQARLLRSDARQILLNCTRQAGKSTSTASLALHTALYEPGALILILAPAERQSKELFRKVRQQAGALGIPNSAIERDTALEIELVNGARMVCLPGKDATIRGFSAVSLLIVDEAARVSDELYRGVRPMLAVSNGRVVLLSSPFGRRGFFFEEWANGGATWERYEVPATLIPRIPAAFLEEERRALGPFFEGEYMCKFLDNQLSVFSYASVMGALSDTVQPLFGGNDGEIHDRA
jgi:hypothetical protein